ncbi:MAG TPA: glycosyltransferase family 9 protein, partial [Holophaga sp.]|nr:glycosyltransferase family 9 protein [Holophaga sp.]
MALCACKALKQADPACAIWFMTDPDHLPVAAACPHVDELFLPEDFFRITEAMHEASFRNPDFTSQQLDHPRFSLDTLHQVEAYLATLKQPLCPAGCKTLDLTLPPLAQESALGNLPPCPTGRRRVVFHAAQGAPNRSWPRRSWETLGRKVLAEGHQLILTGGSDSGKDPLRLELPGSITLQGRLDPLELVGLLRQSDLLVASDSDPIQL